MVEITAKASSKDEISKQLSEQSEKYKQLEYSLTSELTKLKEQLHNEKVLKEESLKGKKNITYFSNDEEFASSQSTVQKLNLEVSTLQENSKKLLDQDAKASNEHIEALKKQMESQKLEQEKQMKSLKEEFTKEQEKFQQGNTFHLLIA